MFEVREKNLSGIPQKSCVAVQKIHSGIKIHVFTGPIYGFQDIVAKIRAAEVRSGDDPLQVGEDAFMELSGNSLYFNHGCEPNAVLSGYADLVAWRDIEVGEEITFDYSTNVTPANDWTMTFDCQCRSPKCRRRIGNILTIPGETLEAYLSGNALQTFMREALRR